MKPLDEVRLTLKTLHGPAHVELYMYRNNKVAVSVNTKVLHFTRMKILKSLITTNDIIIQIYHFQQLFSVNGFDGKKSVQSWWYVYVCVWRVAHLHDISRRESPTVSYLVCRCSIWRWSVEGQISSEVTRVAPENFFSMKFQYIGSMNNLDT